MKAPALRHTLLLLSLLLTSALLHGQEGDPNAPSYKASDDGGASLATRANIEVSPGQALAEDAELGDLWTREKALQDIDPILREAQVAAKANDYKLAEERFIVALARPLTAQERHDALLQLAAMYEEWDRMIKGQDKKGEAISVYEKFIEQFPKNPHLPLINLHLGRLYRKMGAYNMAETRFYDVLNTALNIDEENMRHYERLTLEAKIELANTHYMTDDFAKAVELYKRLSHLDLARQDQMQVLFRLASSYYLSEQLTKALPLLQDFLDEYPDSNLVPEAYFMLANIHRAMGERTKAIATVMKLLKDNAVRNAEDRRTWFYWQKKASNQLANELYEEGEYLEAHRIYSAMAALGGDPAWMAETMYQIGLCLEHLRQTDKAIKAYEAIVSGEPWKDQQEPENSQTLDTVREMAQFRIKHLEWAGETDQELRRIIERSTAGS